MGRRLISSAFISLMVMSYSFADDHDKAYDLLRLGKILPLEKILKIARKQVQGIILEVELEYEKKLLIYELEVLDKKGIVRKIKVNATTGAIVKKVQED